MMNVLEKKVEIIGLYDLYQNVLTDKQKQYFESYYFDDYSISEIAENLSVSRNAVHDQLKRTVSKLYDLEDKLGIQNAVHQKDVFIQKIRDQKPNMEIIKILDDFEKVE